MGLKIVCSGYMIRYPLGGQTWHHLQYIVGLQRLGHSVTFVEHHGWANSCYDPSRNIMTSDPTYGIAYLERLMATYRIGDRWCYFAEDGSVHGMSYDHFSQACCECDLYINISNINWMQELNQCRRKVLIDTDPVFTQIGAHGIGGPFARYDVLFTYGENVHRAGCEMPTAGVRWLPIRQPVVLDLWTADVGDPCAAVTTVMNWTAYGSFEHGGRLYGQKDREFRPFFSLPRETGITMELAINAPTDVRERLVNGGWVLSDPLKVTSDPWSYQRYLETSRAEFSVAKHGYVSTRSGWFSDRSAVYLASGRPVVVQDTGFSDHLPCGEGLLAFRNHSEAVEGLNQLSVDYDGHCRSARAIAEEYFDAKRVLNDLLEQSL